MLNLIQLKITLHQLHQDQFQLECLNFLSILLNSNNAANGLQFPGNANQQNFGAAGGVPPPPPPAPTANATSAESAGGPSRKCFIGGLSWDTTEEALVSHFQKYGNIVDYTIMKDSATGRSRGFGFLTFEDAKSVDALLKDRHVLDGN